MQFRTGDRVRVEYEATVEGNSVTPGRVRLHRDIPGISGLPISVPERYITLIERPEHYEVGELYRSNGGHIYEYRGGTGEEAWTLVRSGYNGFRSSHGNNYRFTMPTRPLTKLVPETTN